MQPITPVTTTPTLAAGATPARNDQGADERLAPRGLAAGGARRRWLREPLLHFLLLGALIFTADLLLNDPADDPRRITIDAAVDQEAIAVFTQSRGRAPDADELYALRRVWLDNEVLYREGLALQMDKGDKAIRDRVIFKALSTINAGLRLPPVDEAVLRAWFEQHRARYDEPARLDFSEALLPDAAPSEAGARALAGLLNASGGGDAQASLRVFNGRPQPNLVQSYGADFTRALEAGPVGEWRVLRQADSWRVVRLEALTPARPASFENLRGPVLQDWTDAVMADQRAAAVKRMAANYRIVTEAPAP